MLRSIPSVCGALRLGPARAFAAMADPAEAGLKTTVLHETHKALGGKMVPFAGYSMPVQYPDGIKASHLHVRSAAGLFDVSHMGQVRLRGADRVGFLEGLVVGDVGGLAEGAAALSLLTTPSGGIIDDTIITNLGAGATGLVINAGCKEKDLAHLREHLADAATAGKDVALEVVEDHELLALQGPAAMDVLSALGVPGLAQMPFMTARRAPLLGADCLVTRCGYTGEDGFEISVPGAKAVELFEALVARAEVRPIGLGARDSLRLEAGLCLYGNDIDGSTSPVEAALSWTIGKRRRAEGGFLGSDVILAQLRDGTARRRCAFVMPKGAPARGGEPLLNEDGEEVGKVTSGGFSPSLGVAIGMGYAKKPFNKSGTKLAVRVRSKVNPVEVRKMPLVPSNYYVVPS